MNWDAISAIADVIGVIVIMITLIYIAAQVRQGNIFSKIQARQSMLDHAHTEIYTQMHNPSITYANVKDGYLSEKEQAQLSFFLTSFMRQREWEWFNYQDGVIQNDVYEAYHGAIAIHLGTERARKGWEKIGRFAFNPDFVSEVDKLLLKTELSTYLKDIRDWDDDA